MQQELMRIHYLSYGIVETGGYRHEKCLYESVCNYWGKHGQIKAHLYRRNKLFQSFFEYLDLMTWAFFKSNADINIVTGRTALSAIFRNWFSNNEVWIVLHNFDPSDQKSNLLTKYYQWLFKLISSANNKRFKVIAVAPYWVDYFKNKKGINQTYLFPNFFDVKAYEKYRKKEKERTVFLGQYSTKNDPLITALAKSLSEKNYHCYFATLDISEVKSYNGSYEIVYFPTHAFFLEAMSKSTCTLALSGVKEGWNRIAHESLLVNTPVVGFMRGGLGDLLKESKSTIVNSIEEAYNCIEGGVWVLPDQDFFERYDLSNTSNYLDIVCSNHSFQF